MNYVKEKKFNRNLSVIILYISFCFNGFYSARGTLFYYGIEGIVLPFILGGILPFLLYEAVTFSTFRLGFYKLGVCAPDLKIDARWYLSAANVASFAAKTVYLFYSLVFVLGEILFHVIFYLLFLALYLVRSAKKYFPKREWGQAVVFLSSMFLIFLAAVTILSMFLGVFF